MSRTVTQAPSVNFETRTTARVIAVQIAPRPLMTIDRVAPAARDRDASARPSPPARA